MKRSAITTPLTSRRAHLAALGGAAAALAVAPRHTAEASANPSVVSDWNATAVAVITADAGKANPEAFGWYALTHAALYNAVVGITRRYQLYKWRVTGPTHASPEAAAAAAAHRVLLSSFGFLPAARARLADAYAASLARIPEGAAKRDGIRYGEIAADRALELRVGDGRAGSLRFQMPMGAGVWRPTPTGLAPFFSPWIAGLRPFLLTLDSHDLDWGAYNADQRTWGKRRNPDGTVTGGWSALYQPAGPPALSSAAYATEFNEVKAIGSKTSALRTPAQTETALFISGIPIVPLQTALRDLVARRGLDISDSARLLAAADMSVADAIRVSWDCKVTYGFWRPITAIHMAGDDGNPATAADPAWEPLLATPPYPDYTSGLCSVLGAATRVLTRILGTDRIDLQLTSPATNTTRRYASAAALCQDGVDARVWSGLHFRFADVDGLDGGSRVADWALDHYFRPAGSA